MTAQPDSIDLAAFSPLGWDGAVDDDVIRLPAEAVGVCPLGFGRGLGR